MTVGPAVRCDAEGCTTSLAAEPQETSRALLLRAFTLGWGIEARAIPYPAPRDTCPDCYQKENAAETAAQIAERFPPR